MIRVLHVIDHLGLGGAQSMLLDLVVATDPRSARCEVAAMHGRGLFADALEARGVTVHSLAPSKWPPLYVPNLVRLLRTNDYDMLHFHLQASNWLAKPVSSVFSGAKRVAHDHSSADLRFRGRWSVWPDAFAHLFSQRVIAVSAGVADFLGAREFVSPRKIHVVHNAVDTGLFAPAGERGRAAARASMGLGADRFAVGALGRLAPEKNFRFVAELARSLPEMDFVVGGTGPERDAISAAAAGAQNFRLLGEVSARSSFYAGLDAFILPSTFEALPMTILEAMASGVPVLASDLEGVASALGDTGVLLPPGDVGAWCTALRSLASDPQRSANMAASARARALQCYDSRAAAEKITDLYRELLA